jgi:Holliday junction DNA helicase RuvB
MSSTPHEEPLSIKGRDQVLDSALRPTLWDEYMGQGHVKANIQILIQAARKRGDMPEHVLFYGPPGVGKTTLAHLVAITLDAPLKTTSGVAIERAGDLAAILTNLEPGTVLYLVQTHPDRYAILPEGKFVLKGAFDSSSGLYDCLRQLLTSATQ